MTMVPNRKQKKGLPRYVGAFFSILLMGASSLAWAQSGYDTSNNLNNRLDQLENQVQTLNRAVYRNETPPAPSPSSLGSDTMSSASAAEGRLSALERKLQELTGRLETIEHQEQQTQMQVEKMQADVDQRFQQLEHPATAAAATAEDAANTENATSSSTKPGPGGFASGITTKPNANHDKEGDGVGKTLGTLTGKTAVEASKQTTTGAPDALYESAFADVRESRYDGAASKFKQFLSLYPHHTLAGNAQYWLAETHYVRADYKQAAKIFAQGYQDHPQGPKAPDCLLKLALSLGKLGRKEDACLSLQQLRKEFPGSTVPASRRAVGEMKTLGCR